MPPKPKVIAELIWAEELRFGATSGTTAVVVDGNSSAGPSPVQLLVIALASCISIDVVDIVRKGRHQLEAFRTALVAERAPENPHRLVKVEMQFYLRGQVPQAAIERAIALSRDKYCSVWHSLRQDIELTTTYEIVQ